MIDLTLSFIQTLTQWDTQIFLWFNGFHCDYADNLMELLSGRFVWIPLYVSLAVVLFRNFHWKVASTFLALAVVLLIINDQTCSSVIRNAVGRLRPSNLDNPISPLVHVVDGYRGGPFGFPSAHSTNSWGLAFFVIYTMRRRLMTLAMVLWAMLVCYSRMYLGVHYFGDLLVGMLLGLVDASLVYYVFQRFLPDMSRAMRSQPLPRLQAALPLIVFGAELFIMFTLAFFVDPAHGI